MSAAAESDGVGWLRPLSKRANEPYSIVLRAQLYEQHS